jgi:hypothetical protein
MIDEYVIFVEDQDGDVYLGLENTIDAVVQAINNGADEITIKPLLTRSKNNEGIEMH